jgi:ribosomal protein S27AE
MCIVKTCIKLEETASNFCYDCEKFPCKRIMQLDKRYRTKYRTSFIENLLMIKEKGIDSFLEFELKRRTCSDCGSVLSVHRNKCLVCGKDVTKNAS